MARASSSRFGLKSLAMTSDAPAARATPTAKQPIGPQPSTSTVLPGTSRLEHGVDRVAHRVHDGADLGGDAVELHDVGGRHRDVVGEGAVAVHADDLGALAEVGVAQAALEAVAADDVSFGGDQVADGEQSGAGRLPAQLDDLAGELVADDDRRLEPAAGPAVPLPDVEIGAADAGVVDADQHVGGSAGGHGPVPQHHSGAGSCLHQSAHGDPG